jgi:hypothetical protein
MEDERVAKVLLGGILNKKIETVEIKGHECAYQSDENNSLKLLRFDFVGTIENPDGTKETVTIELQKASEPEEVMRFRIFILGHSLGKGFEYPLIKGSTVFYDEDDNVLNFKSQCEFLKGMTYHLYIIQIPFLPEKPKKPLEKMLRAFDQRYKLEYDSKYLELSEDKDKDSDFNIIFNRLLYAAADEQLRGNLDLEDYAERLFAFRKAEKEDLEYELKETKVELGEAKVELKETKNQLAASIKLLHSVGISPAQIAAQLNITIDEVNKVL